MPSSITLTVSQLGHSTTFFLSALKPLGYIYRGQACSATVAFGPHDTSVPADFWLTQATPSVPAGAAHVAFPAASQKAVQDFFNAALRAGATVHGGPCLRDRSGYYSAAVIDFDGNSIEAVYRPRTNDGAPVPSNELCSVIAKRSQSRTRSMVSRAPSTQLRSEHAPAERSGPTVFPDKDARPGDALDTLLAQARSAAGVAKQLVDSVRPNLTSSPSAPNISTSSSQVHNKDAFAKVGDASNAVVGGFLGLAAGAAMTFAFTSRSASSSPPNDRHSPDAKSHGGRPGIARSTTMPSHLHQHSQHHHSSQQPQQHYIALHDNDHRSASTRDRRGSFDSAIGVSPPSSTSTTRSSRKPNPKLLHAPPPPSAYRATVPPSTHTRSRSKTRDGSDHHHRRRSRSESRGSNKHSNSHHRHDSGYAESGFETVLHVTTTQQQHSSQPGTTAHASSRARDKDKDKPSKTWSSNKTLPLPMLSNLSSNHHPKDENKPKSRSASKTRSSGKASTAATTVRPPEAYPLQPSRAATWTGDGHVRATKGKDRSPRRDGDGDTFVSARSGLDGRGGGGREGGGAAGDAKTVIGKMRDVRNLRVRGGEVRPEDSVSQVG